MSTIKADGIQAATGTNTDLTLAGKGTGVPDLAAGFKVGGTAGVPTASIQDDAVTLAKMATGVDGVIITYDASGNATHIGPGSDGQLLTSTGAGSPPAFEDAAGGGGGGFTSVQAFTSSGTWTRPADITKVLMFVTGGGGGGAYGTSAGQRMGSGSAGGTAIKFLDVSSISSSTITIGAGGAAHSSSSQGAGSNGGTSSWADGTNTISGTFGTGGPGHGDANPPGIGTNGDLNLIGGAGGVDINTSPAGALTTGGASFWGGGSTKRGYVPNDFTLPYGAYGSGGWGGGSANYAASWLKPGMPGVIFVLEYK